MLWLIFLHAQMDHLTPEMFSKILNHIRDKWITSSKDYPDPDTSLQKKRPVDQFIFMRHSSALALKILDNLNLYNDDQQAKSFKVLEFLSFNILNQTIIDKTQGIRVIIDQLVKNFDLANEYYRISAFDCLSSILRL